MNDAYESGHRTGFQNGLAIGFTASFIVVALVFTALDHAQESWLKEYQALVAGLAALIGALFGVSAVRSQTRDARNIEIERRENQWRAARADLAFPLSSLQNYCVDMLEHIQGRNDTNSQLFPIEANQRLTDTMEVAPLDVSRTIADLKIEIQPVPERLSDFRLRDTNLRALLRARIYIHELFELARGEIA